jgi:aryl-alcohol dehydrogenase-like predicted oxidoreductase
MVNHSNRLPTRVLGKTGVEVPIVGFGTAPAGTRLSLREAVRLYEDALKAGITYFDTAPEFAGYGHAQKQLGHVLRGRRRDIFLVTKCFEPDGSAALRLLERSLRELQTDYADVVFIHSLGDDKMAPQTVFGRKGVYAALMKAKNDGLTLFVGLSGHNRPARFEHAIQQFDIDVLLNAINFVDHHTYNFESRVWPTVLRLDIGLVAMKVFGGSLEPAPSQRSHCLLPRNYLDVGFRYALSVPNTACAVIGMATPEELRANVRRAQSFTALSPGEMVRVRAEGRHLAGRWKDHLGTVV